MGQDIHVYLAKKSNTCGQEEEYRPVELFTKYKDGSYEYAEPYNRRDYELFSWLMDGTGRVDIDESDHPIGMCFEYDNFVPESIEKEWNQWAYGGAYGYNAVTLADIIDHYNMMDFKKYDTEDLLNDKYAINDLKIRVGNFIDDIKRYCSIEGAYYLKPSDILVVYWFDN